MQAEKKANRAGKGNGYAILPLLFMSVCILSHSNSVEAHRDGREPITQERENERPHSSCAVNEGESSVFPSVVDAVIAASNCYNPLSVKEDREYMGAILRDTSYPGKYSYTVKAGVANRDTISISIRIPPGFKLLAFWHTHGGAHWTRRYFSRLDTRLVRRSALPFYLANHRGELLVFEPGSATLRASQAQRLGLGRHQGFAKGRAVRDRRSGQTVVIATSVQPSDDNHSIRQGLNLSRVFR